jgi:hypothetical protein
LFDITGVSCAVKEIVGRNKEHHRGRRRERGKTNTDVEEGLYSA